VAPERPALEWLPAVDDVMDALGCCGYSEHRDDDQNDDARQDSQATVDFEHRPPPPPPPCPAALVRVNVRLVVQLVADMAAAWGRWGAADVRRLLRAVWVLTVDPAAVSCAAAAAAAAAALVAHVEPAAWQRCVVASHLRPLSGPRC
jgi:hypothetical protein